MPKMIKILEDSLQSTVVVCLLSPLMIKKSGI